VSEVMLQQTQASRVAPALDRFLGRFPTVQDLARATRGDVVRAWAGLGYNRRAVALSETARSLVQEHGGRVPRDPELLRRLPGIGAYTAAAVASLAFGEPVVALDTNVRRVVARVWAGRDAMELAPADLRERAERWLDRMDPATWNQALMDLGREICRPRPRCDVCPIAFGCRFLAEGATPVRLHVDRAGSRAPHARRAERSSMPFALGLRRWARSPAAPGSRPTGSEKPWWRCAGTGSSRPVPRPSPGGPPGGSDSHVDDGLRFRPSGLTAIRRSRRGAGVGSAPLPGPAVLPLRLRCRPVSALRVRGHSRSDRRG
jgi:A/G-specific adenine glycosylase